MSLISLIRLIWLKQSNFLANFFARHRWGDTLAPHRAIIRGMKQALQLKLGQQLTLTPQLQQAIKLLQEILTMMVFKISSTVRTVKV